MARIARVGGTLLARLRRAAPWLLIGGILLATGVLGLTEMSGQISPWWSWMSLGCAAAAPVAAVLLDPPRRPTPGPWVTALVFAGAVAGIGHVAAALIVARANSFYSAALLAEGAVVLYLLNAAQAGLKRISPPPTTAAPRTADAFLDGVTVLLLIFLLATAAALRPAAAVAFLLALAFALIAVVFRTPGAAAQLARRR